MVQKYCPKVQPSEYRVHERHRQTDDRQTADTISRKVVELAFGK